MKKILSDIFAAAFFIILLITAGSVFADSNRFTVPSRGAQFYGVNVPANAKHMKAVISGQTEMVNLAIYAPGKQTPSSKNSTWSNLSNWKKDFQCSVSRPNAGLWRVKVEGSVHKGKVKKIKLVAGRLYVYIDGNPVSYKLLSHPATASVAYPMVKEFQFTVPSRGVKYYNISIPANAKRLKAVISGQTEMVNLSLYAPGKQTPASHNSTWSNLSNWRKALQCSVSKPKPGLWRVKVEGSVHKGKADKIKSVSGHLKIYVDGV